ncbi:hypothetical protein WJX72_003963 [[Myrmecia] bisecta]|uniref:Uncharacterized protein n=1 Tax=[Myrmecia] bisecta TaxID=41462 RepID=A0AAW1QER6_9CHLO
MLDVRTQAIIEVCPRDYLPALLHWTAPVEGLVTATIPAITTVKGSAATLDPAATADGDLSDFADAESINVRGLGGYSDTDEAYYSPKSAASASSLGCQHERIRDASYALEASASGADEVRPASGNLAEVQLAGPSGRSASRMAHDSSLESTSLLGECLPQWFARCDDKCDVRLANNSSLESTPLLARVRALEDRLPEQQQRLAEHRAGSARVSAANDANLLTCVETLEAAMHALLRAQNAALDRRQAEAVPQPGCCSCCCVM